MRSASETGAAGAGVLLAAARLALSAAMRSMTCALGSSTGAAVISSPCTLRSISERTWARCLSSYSSGLKASVAICSMSWMASLISGSLTSATPTGTSSKERSSSA